MDLNNLTEEQKNQLIALAQERNILPLPAQPTQQEDAGEAIASKTFRERLLETPQELKEQLQNSNSLRTAPAKAKSFLFDITYQEILSIDSYF